MNSTKKYKPVSRLQLALLCLLSWVSFDAAGITRTTTKNGNWSDPTVWNPAGVPTASDHAIISIGDTITVDAAGNIVDLTISNNALLTWNFVLPANLSVTGNIIVNGKLDICGDLTLAAGKTVTTGPGATIIWNPFTNVVSGATFFTNAIESYDTTSTLIIKKWYDYTVPLGSVVGCAFGNLVMNSPGSTGTITEWNQSNYFETRPVKGDFTVDVGWITLDRSGTITNTIFKNIFLTSANSTLYALRGNHASLFTLTASSITNNGGTFMGIYNGTGNIRLNVNGNVTNSGNIKIINNSGVANVGNGSVTINVTGTFLQTGGDTRFIYNVTTLNCGMYNASIGQLTVNAGIFFGQTGINTTGGTCRLTVSGNLTLALTNTTDIFRGVSLTAIGTNFNMTGIRLIVGGDMISSGPIPAEFTCSAGKGFETVTIGKNYAVTGITNNYNYGATGAAHTNNLRVLGNFTQGGGFVHFSRLSGTATIRVQGNLSLNSGTLSIKSQSGSATATVVGNMTVSGGTMYLHYNSTQATPDINSLTVLGTFSQSNGTINFDDNSSASSAEHRLFICGNQCNLSGGGVMTHAGPGTSTAFGQLSFAKVGVVTYTRASSHLLTQVKQRIENLCTLNVATGNIQVASHGTPGTDYFRITTGGRLELNSNQLLSNALFAYSGIRTDSAGTFALMRSNGLYTGTTNAAINSNRNMDYFLHENSIVEYNGMMTQMLTGIGNGIATGNQHQYGILNIAYRGGAGTFVSPTGNQVFVRNQLNLISGELYLNSFPITILNGATNAVTRTSGYVKSEMNDSNNTSKIVWQNIQPGMHLFPFGKNAATYLPMTFTPQTEFGTTIAVSTRSTTPTTNEPLPSNVVLRGVPSITNAPFMAPHAICEVVDRWWQIDASPLMTADFMLSYAGAENTLRPDVCNSPLGIGHWNGTDWGITNMTSIGVTSGIGTVTGSGISDLSHLIVTTNAVTLPVSLLSFTATATNSRKVRLNWVTASEINNDYFTIERSRNGIYFESVKNVDGAGNSSVTINYQEEDTTPLPGESYYRLKQTDFDGTTSYSEIRHIRLDGNTSDRTLAIEEIGPNPFDNSISFMLFKRDPGTVVVQLQDATGKNVYVKQETCQAGRSKLDIADLGTIASGSYTLQIIDDSRIETKKLIKR